MALTRAVVEGNQLKNLQVLDLAFNRFEATQVRILFGIYPLCEASHMHGRQKHIYILHVL